MAKPKSGLKSFDGGPESVELSTDAPPKIKSIISLPGLSKGSQKLARTFQKLVGAKKPDSPALSVAAHVFLATLTELGFEQNLSNCTVTHTTFGKILPLPDLTNLDIAAPDALALQFAFRNLPELEFFLPYISLRAKLQVKNPGSTLAPEPDYDEDGFLID